MRYLGASLFEVPPGAATFPPHAHYATRSLLIVLAGRLELTAGDGESRGLGPGDVVACPAGRSGAHRLDNNWVSPRASSIVSTTKASEINEDAPGRTAGCAITRLGSTPEEPA